MLHDPVYGCRAGGKAKADHHEYFAALGQKTLDNIGMREECGGDINIALFDGPQFQLVDDKIPLFTAVCEHALHTTS